jgi:small nuclear ribonucleoprotein (snRNP)-like protein
LVRDPDGANEIVSGLRVGTSNFTVIVVRPRHCFKSQLYCLQIEVLLPNKEHTVGELEHYSLHYNVALVSVKNYNVDCPAKLKYESMWYDGTVVAVGRCFESGILMATSGEYIHDYDEVSSDLDCEYLCYTTCRTTKVAPFPFLF